MTIDDINQFIQEDNLKCLIVEATNECCYVFNLSNDVEKAAAIQVVSDKHNFTVGGWSIGKVIPNWVKSFEEWNIYNSGFNQVNNVGAKSFVDDDILGIDSKSKSQNCIDDLQKDVEAREKDIYDDLVTAEENKNINGEVIHNPYLKVMPEHISSNVKTKFDGNADVFLMCAAMSSKRKFQPTSSKQTSQNQLKLMSVDHSGTLKQVKVHTLLFLEYLKKVGH